MASARISKASYGKVSSAQSNAESDITGNCHCSPEYGEGVTAPRYESDICNDHLEYRHKHRARRSAKERRAQQLRSDTRMLTRILSGLDSVREHRGNTLSHVGSALLQILGDSQSASVAKKPDGYAPRPMCRHYLNGRCTFGSSCHFSHDNQYDFHPYADINPHDGEHCHHEDASEYNSELVSNDWEQRDESNSDETFDVEPYQVYSDLQQYDCDSFRDNQDLFCDGHGSNSGGNQTNGYDGGSIVRTDCRRTRLLLAEFAKAANVYVVAKHGEAISGHLGNDHCDDGSDDCCDHVSEDPAWPQDSCCDNEYVDEILEVLGSMSGQDKIDAYGLLPAHLQAEVNQCIGHDRLLLDSLQSKEASLDRQICETTLRLLDFYSFNQKLVRKAVGSHTLSSVLKRMATAKKQVARYVKAERSTLDTMLANSSRNTPTLGAASSNALVSGTSTRPFHPVVALQSEGHRYSNQASLDDCAAHTVLGVLNVLQPVVRAKAIGALPRDIRDQLDNSRFLFDDGTRIIDLLAEKRTHPPKIDDKVA